MIPIPVLWLVTTFLSSLSRLKLETVRLSLAVNDKRKFLTTLERGVLTII